MKKFLIPALFALGLTATPFTFADDMPLTTDETEAQFSDNEVVAEANATDPAAVTTETTETVSKTEAAPTAKTEKHAAKKSGNTKVAKHVKKEKKSVSKEKS